MMADDDTDSSGTEDIQTNVVLGYASRSPTGEPFSQLGGHPTWLDEQTVPSGALIKCKTCRGLMSLLLQIRGDLNEFPTHERRLYVWTCRRKACRRQEGSTRAFRATKHNVMPAEIAPDDAAREVDRASQQPSRNLGEMLFGVKDTPTKQANPFSTSSGHDMNSDPSSTGTSTHTRLFVSGSGRAAKEPQGALSEGDALSETFAQKARISMRATEETPGPQSLQEPWPHRSAFPDPFPSYNIEPEREYIDLELSQSPVGTRFNQDIDEGNSNSAEDKVAFESSMDRTFQRFADRLAQNPEQVLRYEYAGQPLMYSKTDAVGKLLVPAQENANVKVNATASANATAKMPRCMNCGAERVFEVQLTPHAITELEAEEISIDGMDWGTVIVGVCREDCQERGREEGEVGYVEEWVGVQWEELAGNTRPS